MQRLLLIRHGTTAETRRAAFPTTTGARTESRCESLDAAGSSQALALGGHLPRADRGWTSFAARSVETARALGLAALETRAELAECDFGAWSGLTLDEVHSRDAAGLEKWLADPACTPHGGESLDALRERARRVLAAASSAAGTTVAVTHGGLVKAALLEVLRLPASALWQLDVAPCSVTELHPGASGWRIVTLSWTPRLRGVSPSDGE